MVNHNPYPESNQEQQSQTHDGHSQGCSHEDGHKHHHPHKEYLHVTVHYPAAAHPFVEPHASHRETVGGLKAKVLKAFHLHEGTGPDGSVTTYTLYFHKHALDNMDQTLGDLAGDNSDLKFKLAQQIVQGIA